MTDIQIDDAKVQRIIAQVLRDEKGLLPAEANSVAANICRRLQTSMAAPTSQGLRGYRMIQYRPPDEAEFASALSERIADVNFRVARELWELVYDRCENLPPSVADASRY